MSLLLLWGGASGAPPSFTPIAFGNTLAVLLPDEIAAGLSCTFYAEVIDSSGAVAPDAPLQVTINGFTSGGARTNVVATAEMTFVSGQLYSYTWTPSVTGVYEVIVAAKVGGTAYPVARPLTVRTKFDPIGFAIDEVLVSRMDGESALGTA